MTYIIIYREEVESATWKMISAKPENLKNVLLGLRGDPLISLYR
jgi:hypothetical protein